MASASNWRCASSRIRSPCPSKTGSRGERRWQTLGMVEGVLLLLVAHTFLEEGDVEVVRIISARRAERQERRRYEQENR